MKISTGVVQLLPGPQTRVSPKIPVEINFVSLNRKEILRSLAIFEQGNRTSWGLQSRALLRGER